MPKGARRNRYAVLRRSYAETGTALLFPPLRCRALAPHVYASAPQKLVRNGTSQLGRIRTKWVLAFFERRRIRTGRRCRRSSRSCRLAEVGTLASLRMALEYAEMGTRRVSEGGLGSMRRIGYAAEIGTLWRFCVPIGVQRRNGFVNSRYRRRIGYAQTSSSMLTSRLRTRFCVDNTLSGPRVHVISTAPEAFAQKQVRFYAFLLWKTLWDQ